ncbi:hypothetical protein [Brevibacillus borstelensis]|jgi:hypothetical protein|uniref:hypothetical protein n=1 Tax=Brevibacillus borstelensis TaxID=45462 RepID=UPI0004F25B7B|nr:hypothetical protein [Brevibacillus borstelensis]KKX56343.1 hypothetical protein X546_04445 [Brevibacillus borstelensis cifa_chp40]MED2006697.1 hypothetical protein [Brevibacillus borstelensis]
MSKLEKFLAKASQDVVRKEITVEIDGDTWRVRQLSLTEIRACENQADKGEKFDWHRFNDARIVKATEHDFPWNDNSLKEAYGVHTKYELPAKLFEHNLDGYSKLLDAVRRVNADQSEREAVDEAKN